VIVSLSLPLPLEPSGAEAGDDPTLVISASPRKVRLRRSLPSSSERTWLLDIEIELPARDPEQILAESEGFVVDATDGSEVGVVAGVEFDPEGELSALVVSAGWLDRHRFRIEAEAIETILPGERRIVVRA
jgi:hypothetical protein